MKNEDHEHEWVVFSTAISECYLLVQCARCGTLGTVADPTKEEWSEAYYAPDTPYRWDDASRVTIRREGGGFFYVKKIEPDKEQ